MSTFNFTLVSDVSTVLKDGVVLYAFGGKPTASISPSYVTPDQIAGFTLSVAPFASIPFTLAGNAFQVNGVAAPTTDFKVFAANVLSVFPKAGTSATPTGSTQTTDYQEIIATQGQTVFTITGLPASKLDYMIEINGGGQRHSDYTTSGNNLTFTSGGLDSGDVLMYRRFK